MWPILIGVGGLLLLTLWSLSRAQKADRLDAQCDALLETRT